MSDVPKARSEAEADEGYVVLIALGEQSCLSEAVAWLDDDGYVIRSTEFDLLATAGDFGHAVESFAEQAVDYAALLAELIQREEATPDERQSFETLSARLMPVMRAAERAATRRSFRLPRLRNARSGHWRRRGTQANNSSQLSVA